MEQRCCYPEEGKRAETIMGINLSANISKTVYLTGKNNIYMREQSVSEGSGILATV